MISFPNAKINLGLHVVEKRNDGFHSIETVFYPVLGLADILEINPLKEQKTSLKVTGIAIDAPPANNLCVKAWQLLHTDYSIPPVAIHLHKQIPFGAGLGGGSADASQTLIMLNTLFNLQLNQAKLHSYAQQLGSDCAFFLENKPMLAKGRGDLLSPIKIDLSDYYIAIVKPEIKVSTAQAYAGITPCKPTAELSMIIQTPIEDWKDTLKNDFEENIGRLFPEIHGIKQQLYKQGALYASMSGSGSSVFGLFKEQPSFQNVFSSHFVHISRL